MHRHQYNLGILDIQIHPKMSLKYSQCQSQSNKQDQPEMMSNISNLTSTKEIPVYLVIYNFWSCFNRVGSCLGIGVYHTGIEIFNDQYMYFGFDGDETGVGFIEPQGAAYEFAEKLLLGYTTYDYFKIDREILEPLRMQFIGKYKNYAGNRYDLLNYNCNHFAKRFAEMLNVAENFPPKIFRVTNFFNRMRCCIPNCILNGRLDWFDFSKNDEEDAQYQELQEELHEKHMNIHIQKSPSILNQSFSKAQASQRKSKINIEDLNNKNIQSQLKWRKSTLYD